MLRASLTSRLRFVWSQDSALNTEAEGFDEAWKTYEKTVDPAELPVRAGDRLSIFHCERLTREAFYRFQNLVDADRARACDEAIRTSLKAVENVELSDGRPLELEFENGVVASGSLDRIFHNELFQEMAAFVLMRSRLDPTSGQG